MMQGLCALWQHLEHCNIGFSMNSSLYRVLQKAQSSGSKFCILHTISWTISSFFLGIGSLMVELLRNFNVFVRCGRFEHAPFFILLSMSPML